MGQLKRIRIIGGPYPLIIWSLLGLHLLIQIASFVFLVLTSKLPAGIVVWHLTILVCLIAFAIPAWRHRRARIALVRKSDGHVCIDCGYPLEAELDGKPCPECGTPINLAHCRKIWLKTLGGW